MLYRPKISDFSGEPVVLESPTGTESFDEITATHELILNTKKQTGIYRPVDCSSGFIAVAAALGNR